MKAHDVYIGLGGNIGDTMSILETALNEISQIEGVRDLRVSRFYQTTPVSEIPQNDFINAVCQFQTTLSPLQLYQELHNIEIKLGKIPKPKNAPRCIDLDILFYGEISYKDETLTIPHPRWDQRLFVLEPLADLVTELKVPCSHSKTGLKSVNIKQLMENKA